MPNELVTPITDVWLQSGGFDTSAGCIVGHWSGDPTDGAIRFENIAIPTGASVDLAILMYRYYGVGGNSGSWIHEVNGIDEDNTAPFGYPFGRPLTGAQINVNEGPPTSGGTKAYDVRSLVNEIVQRGGWSSGNAMGFILRDTGSSTNIFAQANLGTSYFVYRVSSAPNFKPTPKNVAAPSLPAAEDWGIKISRPSQSVLTATENQLYLTTRKKQFKILDEDSFVSTGTGVVTINHGLGYTPIVEVRYKEPSSNQWYDSPYVTSFSIGVYHRTDANNLYIYVPDTGYSIYYYISLDQLV